jgi:hypothetical protein
MIDLAQRYAGLNIISIPLKCPHCEIEIPHNKRQCSCGILITVVLDTPKGLKLCISIDGLTFIANHGNIYYYTKNGVEHFLFKNSDTKISKNDISKMRQLAQKHKKLQLLK